MRAASAGVAAILPLPALAQSAGAQVVVVGGGSAGATCAQTLKRLEPRLAVTIVEANPTRVFTAQSSRHAYRYNVDQNWKFPR
jgi:glycine/D-amino acid oxidase-like deaminating enzyme